jgi:broad specificity phosphatase PhoE
VTRIFIVRHGDTFEPTEPSRRIGARTDLPIVASGRLQAATLGRWFAAQGIRFGRALAGPLIRTIETAGIILSYSADPPPLEMTEWLREVDHGPDEGQSETAVIARLGTAAIEDWDREGVPPPGWNVDAAARLAAWDAYLSAPPEGDSLLVTSSGAARFAVIARPELQPPGSLKLRTGAVAVVKKDGNGGLETALWNFRP